jgi:mannitol/fructose-specific phosphotransferase system IIA component (Ntr-type)
LKLLSGLAAVLQHKDKVDRLMQTRDAAEVVAILTDSEART